MYLQTEKRERNSMAYVSQEMKKNLAPAIKQVLNKYGMKGSLSVNNHSTLVCNIKEGKLDFSDYMNGDNYIQVNEYWIDRHYKGTHQAFLSELLAAMRGPDYFDNSDPMTDYFSTSHYTDINIGRWSTPYVQK